MYLPCSIAANYYLACTSLSRAGLLFFFYLNIIVSTVESPWSPWVFYFPRESIQMQLLVSMYVSMLVSLFAWKNHILILWKSVKKSKNIYVDQYIFKQNLKKITSLYLLSTLFKSKKKSTLEKNLIFFRFEYWWFWF